MRGGGFRAGDQVKRNPARARREIRVRAYEDGEERWAWHTVPPELTPGHFDLHEVRDAIQFAAQAHSQSETDKGLLGGGNFGVAFLVETQRGGVVVVKLPARTNIHGRVWQLSEQRTNFMHEAGVANELQALGVGLVPATVYVEFADGKPALVREYGEPVTKMSVEEFAEVEQALMAVDELGWAVEDDIALYRRPDGSVFVGDVGIWHPKAEWKPGTPPDTGSLGYLIPLLAETMLGTRITTLEYTIRLAHRLRATLADDDEKRVFGRSHWAAQEVKRLRHAIADRQEIGLPVPAEATIVLAEAERFLAEEPG